MLKKHRMEVDNQIHIGSRASFLFASLPSTRNMWGCQQPSILQLEKNSNKEVLQVQGYL